MAPAFGLSRQTQSKRRKLFLSLVASLTVATSSFSLSSSVWAGEVQAAANRLATYETAAGEHFFALAVAPQVDDVLRTSLSEGPRSVLIVVDTSATQTGDARLDSLEAASGVLDGLSADCQVLIAAVDVKTVMLIPTFAAADSAASKAALAKLEQRLPLGKTDLASALETGVKQLTGRAGHRSVIYIGDGSSLGKIRDNDYFEKIVDRLSKDQISVHSLVVGVSTDLGLLATLANHTGGVTLVRDANEQASGQQFGMLLAGAAGTSPIWPTELTMPSGYDVVQESRIPPVRIDRDSVLIGRMTVDSVVAEKAQPVVLRGTAAGKSIELSWEIKPEESNLDFAFLPSLVVAAEPNDGLMLPTAGSAALRVAASAMAHRAEELVRAGRMALSQGNFKGARALAESALTIDPNHSDAKAILAAVAQEKTLTATQDGNPFGNDPATGDDNPFGDAFDAPAGGASGTLGEVSGDADIGPFGNGAADAVVPPPGGSILRDEPSGLLDRFEGERTALEGQWRAEVRAALGSARIGLPLDPVGVYGDLKGLMSRVESVPEIGPAVRQTLLAQLQSAAQQASRAVTVYEETQANLQQQQAAAAATTRLLQETNRREARLANAVELFNGLIVEGDYQAAVSDVTPMIQELDGYRTIGEHTNAYGDLGLSVSRANRYRDLRHRAFVDALALNERALIPFVDEPPVVYPDAEVWARLSVRRLARYGAVELNGSNDSERRIYNALENEYSGNFNQIPLEDAIRQIATENDIPIIINTRALEDIGLTRDVPITVNLKNVSLRSFLRIMLRENDLAYMIKDEVLQITTDEDANSEDNMITKVYPVGDLVVPVINLGGMGGMMGGMGGMGGGMGGMGGGMGGMGGGMGGMGGGMGGMGGGMGGMMSMPDDVSLTQKATAPVDTDQNRGDVPIRVTPQAGQSLDAAWNEHFKNLDLSTPEAVKTHDARVRTTVRQLNLKASNALSESNPAEAKKHFEEVRAVIAAALLNGAVQPWMHQGYALALEGTGAPREEVERALLSAADIATSPEELLLLASHLERLELFSGAFELCRDAVRAQPYHREAYLVGLRLAKEMDDVDAMAWACEGVLGQAWQAGQERLENEVRLLARATYQQLIEDGKATRAEEFAKSVNGAMVRDCIVEVTWTGDADIDLMIEEPSGTICSLHSPRSSSGGVLIGDGYSTGRAEKDGQITETYVCPEGFSGQYRLLVKRVWGEVSTGQVTVRILTDVGRPSQRLIQEMVTLQEKDALFTFEVKDGRRQQEMAAAQVEQLAEVQNRLNGTILAQVGNGPNDPGMPNFPGVPNVPGNGGIGDPGNSNNADLLRAFYRDRRLMQLARAGGFGRGAVGFQPQISVIPEGTMMQVMGVISGDRRYVRISPAPNFTSITDVQTFNFVTGEGGAGGAGGGGGVGGGGGIGGGGGGGGFGGGGGGGIL